MRISDWSSDVCSSDLCGDWLGLSVAGPAHHLVAARAGDCHCLQSGRALRIEQCQCREQSCGKAGLSRFFLDRRAGGLHCYALYRRSEEHTSELQSLMRISYADFCLKKKRHTEKLRRHERTHKCYK